MKYSRSLFLLSAIMLLTACVSTPVDPSASAKPPVVSPEVMKKYSAALQLMERGNHDAALKVLAAVSKMDDRLSGPYVNSGLIYLQQQKKEQAREAFENAIQRNPNNAAALTQLAVLQREDFAFDEARKNYSLALATDPAYLPAHLNLGILCDLYIRDYSCARDHYEEYLRLKGDDKDVNNWLIDLKERM